MGILIPHPVIPPAQFFTAVGELLQDEFAAVLATTDDMTFAHSQLVQELSVSHRLPVLAKIDAIASMLEPDCLRHCHEK